MFSNQSVPQASSPKKERTSMQANTAQTLSVGHSMFAIQRHAGNRALSSLLQRKSNTTPIQRFQDTGIDVDVSALTDPILVNRYIKGERGDGITAADLTELEDRFQQLISNENDPFALFNLIEQKDALHIDGDQLTKVEQQFIVLIPAMTDATLVFKYLQMTDQFIDPNIGSTLEDQLEELKYEKGIEMEAEEHNYDSSMIVERSNLLDKINTEGSAVAGFKTGRYKPQEKKRKFDEALKSSFTREGSVGFDLEGKYKGDSVEKQGRMKISKKTSDNYNKEVRTAAERLDSKHREVHFTDPNPKGTNIMKSAPAIYLHEGTVGIYGKIGTTGPKDFFEYDHQPQNDLIEAAAELNIASGKKIEEVAEDHSSGGLTIVLKHHRHAAGATYGKASAYKPAMLAIDSMKGEDDDKIKAAKDLLVKATAEDAEEILDVYKDYARNYQDIDDILTDRAEAEALKKKIHSQVTTGEARMKAQTFDSWFEKK